MRLPFLVVVTAVGVFFLQPPAIYAQLDSTKSSVELLAGLGPNTSGAVSFQFGFTRYGYLSPISHWSIGLQFRNVANSSGLEDPEGGTFNIEDDLFFASIPLHLILEANPISFYTGPSLDITAAATSNPPDQTNWSKPLSLSWNLGIAYLGTKVTAHIEVSTPVTNVYTCNCTTFMQPTNFTIMLGYRIYSSP